jgi:hypothetical protein
MNITLKRAGFGTGDYHVAIDDNVVTVGFNVDTIDALEKHHSVDGVDCVADNMASSLVLARRIRYDQAFEAREALNERINELLGRSDG